MSSFSVQLKVAGGEAYLSGLREYLSPTAVDGFEPLPDLSGLPVDELRINNLDQIFSLMQSDDTINTKRVVLDLRELTHVFHRLMVYLAPVFYRWKGEQIVVILPEDYQNEFALPSIGDLLRSLELRSRGIRLVSCPTCARCRTDFPQMVREIEDKLGRMDKPLDVAVMGCEVNGPGEARAADIGIAFGDQKGMLFKNGEKVKVVSIEEAADVLLEELEKM